MHPLKAYIAYDLPLYPASGGPETLFRPPTTESGEPVRSLHLTQTEIQVECAPKIERGQKAVGH